MLAKLYTQLEKERDLLALVQEPNSVVLSEVEGLLEDADQFSALCALYRRDGDDRKLLDLWSKYVSIPSSARRT